MSTEAKGTLPLSPLPSKLDLFLLVLDFVGSPKAPRSDLSMLCPNSPSHPTTHSRTEHLAGSDPQLPHSGNH